jgi:hypothetical protein
MPVPPGPQLGAETGLDEAQWILEVRDAMHDYPLATVETTTADGVSGAGTASSLPYRVTRPPIQDNTVLVSVAGAAITVFYVDQQAAGFVPGAGQCLVNLDTGEIVFGTVPAANQSVAVKYTPVYWRDRSILTALADGFRRLPPNLGKTGIDETIRPQVNVWDYVLPSWASDPRSLILNVKVKDIDTTIVDWSDIVRWERVGTTILRLPSSQWYSPSGRFQIVYWMPYIRLGDMEPHLYHMPITYAAAMLLFKRAAVLMRADSMPSSQDGAQGATTRAQVMVELAKELMAEFKAQRSEMARTPGPGRRMRIVAPAYQI